MSLAFRTPSAPEDRRLKICRVHASTVWFVATDELSAGQRA